MLFLGEQPVAGEENLSFKQASPTYFVNSNSAAKPYLIINSEVDGLVPHTQGCELKLALEAAGATDATMLLYPEGGHLSFIDYRNVKTLAASDNLADSVLNIFSFLDHHLKAADAPDYSESDASVLDSATCVEILEAIE